MVVTVIKELFPVFLLIVFFSPVVSAAEVTVRLGGNFIGFEGYSREDVSVALREELQQRLTLEQQPSGEAARTYLPDSWNEAITRYQNNVPDSHYFTLEFTNQHTIRRAELLREVSQLQLHGTLTFKMISWSGEYTSRDVSLALRTEPTHNLIHNASLLNYPIHALGNVLSNPAQYTLLEALIAAHSYLYNCYREAGSYPGEARNHPANTRNKSILFAPQRFWAIEDLMLIIHIIDKNTSTEAGAIAASTPLDDINFSLLSLHRPFFTLDRSTFNAQCSRGQVDLYFDRGIELVAAILGLYEERLTQSHDSPDAKETEQVIAVLNLLMKSISPQE